MERWGLTIGRLEPANLLLSGGPESPGEAAWGISGTAPLHGNAGSVAVRGGPLQSCLCDGLAGSVRG
jgi:hypothetical protein